MQRVDLAVALKSVNARKIASYFRTTLTTNLIKFPMVEVLNKAVEKIPVPDAVRGVAVGAIFTTATLPITNFRYCRSVGEPVTFGTLYKAYFPTVCRDIVYNVARTSTNKGMDIQFSFSFSNIFTIFHSTISFLSFLFMHTSEYECKFMPEHKFCFIITILYIVRFKCFTYFVFTCSQCHCHHRYHNNIRLHSHVKSFQHSANVSPSSSRRPMGSSCRCLSR